MSYRADEIMNALKWLQMARETLARMDEHHLAKYVAYDINTAEKGIRRALDIRPSEAAVDEIVQAQKEVAA